jgi:glycosyltransferase involved in cell wall biosynthesis
MMGIGKPVVVTSGEETDTFPDTACVRVDSGPAEAEMLAATMAWLAGAGDHRLGIGDAARRHVREQHDPERVAGLYWRVLEECGR